jgi:hypothetical protein
MNEYADRLAIDVVSAPLAEIDRRTLSQAWYSALHLARDPAAAPQSPGLAQGTVQASAPLGATSVQVVGRTASVDVARASNAGNAATVREGLAERRRPPSVLAKNIERALARTHAPNRRATLTMQGRTGRIELLVRSAGDATHVIAVCSPGARARVEQALAHARFTLARRGIGLQARTQAAQP